MEVTAVGIRWSGCIAAALLVLTANSEQAGADPIDQITVQGQRDRLKHQVNTFVSNAIVQTHYDETHDLNFGQISDYIGMIGLAQINLDKDLGGAPSILNLFRNSGESRSREMTVWDKALLHALYSTPQRSKMQLSEMQTTAFEDITAKAQN